MLVYVAIVVATFVVSSSIGLLVGGLLTSSKVSYLTDQLDQTHMILNFQMKVIEDLSSTTRKLLDTLDAQGSNSINHEMVERLKLTLVDSDRAIGSGSSIKS